MPNSITNNKEKLKAHSKHHTPSHMRLMRSEIKKGKSFSAAHKTAQRRVGK